jgi:uncharacterized membrane protein YeaQ/YmgE (transglycosylase-associated protein family)
VATVLGVLSGIGKQVQDNLFQPGCIGVQPDGLRRQRHRKFMPAFVDQMGNSLYRTLHNATHMVLLSVWRASYGKIRLRLRRPRIASSIIGRSELDRRGACSGSVAPLSQTTSQGEKMNLIIWLVVGGIIGWLASMVMKTDGQQGIILNVVVGIVGALIAGLVIAPLLGTGTINTSDFSVSGLIVSFLGAIVLLVIVNLFRRGAVR